MNKHIFAVPPFLASTALVLTTIAAYPLLLVLEPKNLLEVGREDGLIESIGAAFYGLASAMMALAYFRSRGRDNRFFGRPTNANVFFILLAIFFFICAGEEISWGQRIVGWHTPEGWSDVNAQNETNIHNIWMFQATNPDGSQKSQLELMLYPGRVVFLIALLYCVVVPVLYASSAHVRRWVEFAGLPVPFLFSGALFLLAYATRKTLIANVDVTKDAQRVLGETQETLFAMCFAVTAAYFYRSVASRGEAER